MRHHFQVSGLARGGTARIGGDDTVVAFDILGEVGQGQGAVGLAGFFGPLGSVALVPLVAGPGRAVGEGGEAGAEQEVAGLVLRLARKPGCRAGSTGAFAGAVSGVECQYLVASEGAGVEGGFINPAFEELRVAASAKVQRGIAVGSSPGEGGAGFQEIAVLIEFRGITSFEGSNDMVPMTGVNLSAAHVGVVGSAAQIPYRELGHAGRRDAQTVLPLPWSALGQHCSSILAGNSIGLWQLIEFHPSLDRYLAIRSHMRTEFRRVGHGRISVGAVEAERRAGNTGTIGGAAPDRAIVVIHGVHSAAVRRPPS